MANEYVMIVPDLAAIELMKASPEIIPMLEHVDNEIVDDARRMAPKRTGLGAASIHGHVTFNDGEWQGRIGWDVARYYMGFQDRGTRFMPPKLFIELATDRHADLKTEGSDPREGNISHG